MFVAGEYKWFPDYQYATTRMLKDFGRGNLGLVNFDVDVISQYQGTEEVKKRGNEDISSA